MAGYPTERSDMITYTARLDKTGDRVICGKIDCGRDIAPIISGDPPVNLDTLRPVYPPGTFDDRGMREVMFGPGWIQAPGWTGPGRPRWVMTKHARARLLRGKEPKFRREFLVSSDEAPGQPYHEARLPAEAVCPWCGFVNVLDHKVLEVIANP
jgi:hypothetical protein